MDSFKEDAPDHEDARLQRDRFVAFSFAATDFVFEVDSEGLITFASGAAKELTGQGAKDLVGTIWTDFIDSRDRPKLRRIVENLDDVGRSGAVPVRLAGRTSSALNVIFNACRLPHRIGFAFCTLSASNVLVALQGPTKHRDEVSGLLDSDGFSELAQGMLNAQCPGDEPVELTLIDLDSAQFSRDALDTEGYTEFMANLGVTLRTRAVGGNLAGQLADSKFGVIHDSSIKGDDIAQEVMDLTKAFSSQDASHTVSASTLDLDTKGLSEEETGQALIYAINEFATANQGSVTVRSLQDGFRTLAKRTTQKIDWLKSQISERRFGFCFQPIVDLRSRSLQHYELLIRFDDKQSPYPWVTFAEGIGLIQDLDLAIVETAIEFLRKGSADKSVSVAINLSGKSLSTPAFVEELLSLLIVHESISNRLLIEITESAKIDDLRQVNKAVLALRGIGFSIGLDDFGAGSVSIEYLRALDVEFVKFDGAYTRRIMELDRECAILKAMIGLCHDLKIRTIAEMIESKAQAERAASLGADLGQGYYFGKPAKPSEYGIVAPGAKEQVVRPATFAPSRFNPFTGAELDRGPARRSR